MLILSGTAVTVALDGEGLFGKANTAVQKWNNKVKEEENINSALEYLNELIDKKVYTKYTLGQEVTVGGEHFFVIEEDTTNKDTITLIAKYNLKTNTNEQVTSTSEQTDIAFCTDPNNTYKGYWKDNIGLEPRMQITVRILLIMQEI